MNQLAGIAYVAGWAALLALTLVNRDFVQPFQPFVRAETVPLALAGLTLILGSNALEHRAARWLLPCALVLIGIQVLQLVTGAAGVEIALAVVVATGLTLKFGVATSDRLRQQVTLVLLALLASESTLQYLDYPVRRVGVIPASVFLVIARTIAAALVLAGCVGAMAAARNLSPRLTNRGFTGVMIAVVASTQVAYFFVDLFTNPAVRLLHVALVLTLIVGLAALVTERKANAAWLWDMTAVSLFTLLCLRLIYP